MHTPGTAAHLLAFQTALLHLKPLPKPNCHTRSPVVTPLNVSMYAKTYQMLLLLTFPYLHHTKSSGGGSAQQRECAAPQKGLWRNCKAALKGIQHFVGQNPALRISILVAGAVGRLCQ